ncbi:glucose-6-phosphate isomerase [Oceanospirillaceae bacterium]|jgi:glucose-6-phosphate isomerase|uniref:glucose-6-phosphate isomerase n=1 Tax=Candidatus Njordibacter sp. Uisw_002 TaxID=3230971 RepID=UPI00233976F2|nr:glucose-6-phosphate isomerase [Oceanospirillaceae bacterium]MDB9753354.1 glucose-6-phosphate isomerase [Oceanospirillaceae bacterium]MDB9957542.1 glucose-6-phosphate isomerase [Oceanospirillaceae bacterium]MDC1341330.1 glucose-6-phosphate isomerase [Oceanospirillaceae bacterium]|tara:strand:+ start:3896 stop:5536 length:1641 start_codon:yes stop_codon:yes gene_type:complete
MLQLEKSKHWQKLQQLAVQHRSTHLRELFAKEGNRFETYSIELPNLLLDYSKNCLTPEIMDSLFGLAQDMGLSSSIERMYRGAKINITEDRAVLHTALRNRSNSPVYVDQTNVMDMINDELSHMRTFVEKVRSGEWLGYSGKRITDVVNIGIGGSNLGPKMVTQALRSYADSTIRVHFISNVDGVEIAEILRPLNAEQVLFVVASKTFTTSETMTNAQTARNWLMASAFDERAVQQHFVAVSSNTEAVQEFGIDAGFRFSMWDWVGGRYSIWSAIGLPIALYLGFDKFEQLLIGAHDMDLHFRDAPAQKNMPTIMALVGIWNGLLHGAQSHVILPYDQPLESFTDYIQQADMESNGKHVDRQGNQVAYPTASVVWGQLGIDGQHAFYQLLHQGNVIVPADFIGSLASSTPVKGHHENLMANFFAQTEALMNGISAEEVRSQLEVQGLDSVELEKLLPHKVHQGNRPSNTVLLKQIDPRNLGSLIALYEHKIFAQGVIWDLCSFDQWGVELGKTLAKGILQEIEGEAGHQHDDSTNALIDYFKASRN